MEGSASQPLVPASKPKVVKRIIGKQVCSQLRCYPF